MKKLKHNVLIFCGLGYFFEDFVELIIKDLEGKCNVFLIMEDSYLSKKLVGRIESLHKKGSIGKYYITHIDGRTSIVYRYFQALLLINKLKSEKIDLFLFGNEEGTIIQCFLMEYFKLKGTVIVSSAPMIRPRLMRDYYRTKGLFLEKSGNERLDQKLRRKIKNKEFAQILKVIVNLPRRLAKKLKQKLQDVLGQRVIPFLLIGQSIQRINQYIIGTFCDHLIVNDSVEYEGAKLLLPNVKKLHLAKHPAYGFCKDRTNRKRTKVLVFFPK